MSLNLPQEESMSLNLPREELMSLNLPQEELNVIKFLIKISSSFPTIPDVCPQFHIVFSYYFLFL
jgi:hypothetical protein